MIPHKITLSGGLCNHFFLKKRNSGSILSDWTAPTDRSPQGCDGTLGGAVGQSTGKVQSRRPGGDRVSRLRHGDIVIMIKCGIIVAA
jgi:hypothetical protein